MGTIMFRQTHVSSSKTSTLVLLTIRKNTPEVFLILSASSHDGIIFFTSQMIQSSKLSKIQYR